MEKTDILSLSLEELIIALDALGEKKFRAEQIFSWLHVKKVTEFEEMTNISLELRTKLSENFYIKRLNIAKRLESCTDNTIKYLYELDDGNHIETVLMEYKHGNSICISTQVGCRMGCRFCASAIAGFVRNLTPAEMLLQIYETERAQNCKISSLVLMGIGEPLDNFDNVLRFLQLLSDPNGYGMSLRHVTVSTCGVVPKILELAEQRLGLTLSVSLHCPNDAGRSAIMPINRSYPIDVLLDACQTYFEKTGRRVTFEYAVMDQVNSAEQDAAALAERLKGLHAHVNLIPINPVKERNFHTLKKTVLQFQKTLERYGIPATIRRTLGSDIEAACGQLRRDAIQQT